MQAIVVHQPGGPDVLTLEDRPIPAARPGWVLVRVRAFGLNRAELITRSGGSGDNVKFPRVIGIECAGEVADARDGDLEPGQTVVAAMGEMGRAFDGGYQQYALLPATHVIPSDDARLGDARGDPGDLRHGVGLARGTPAHIRRLAAHPWRHLVSGHGRDHIAKDRGLTVFATTRQEAKRAALAANGADHVLIDDGAVAARVREIAPGGVTGSTSWSAPRRCSTRCMRSPPAGGPASPATSRTSGTCARPRRRRATRRPAGGLRQQRINRASYGRVFQDIIRRRRGRALPRNIDRTFTMTRSRDAHRYMEANRAVGKLVVLTPDD